MRPERSMEKKCHKYFRAHGYYYFLGRASNYQTVDVWEDEEADPRHEGGDSHGLAPDDGGHELAGVDVDHGKGGGDLELAHHGERHCRPRRSTCCCSS